MKMAIRLLNGPHLRALSGKPPKSLVVFLHGYGSNGQDLISLAPFMQKELPETEFLAPNAPDHWQGMPMTRGYQWFELGLMDPGHIINGMRKSIPILNAYLDNELAARNLTDKNLVLVGFSQGTMMALQVGLTRPKACAGILGYSGAYYADPLVESVNKVPVMLIHGDADVVLSMEYFNNAVESLHAQGIQPETHVRPHLGHGIDPIGLKLGTDFLKKVLYDK
jgi:phospholipase/carboxylesterase